MIGLDVCGLVAVSLRLLLFLWFALTCCVSLLRVRLFMFGVIVLSCVLFCVG